MGMIDDLHLPTIRRKGRTEGQGDIANNLSEHWVITDFMVDGVLLSLLTCFLYSYYLKKPTAIPALLSLHGILFYIHICFEYFVQASVGRSFFILTLRNPLFRSFPFLLLSSLSPFTVYTFYTHHFSYLELSETTRPNRFHHTFSGKGQGRGEETEGTILRKAG